MPELDILDKIFLLAEPHFNQIFYLKSANYKEGFSGDLSILAFDIEEKTICDTKEELDNFVENLKQSEVNEFENACFCIIGYEASGIFTSNVILQKLMLQEQYINSNTFKVKNQILIYKFKQVIVYNRVEGKIIYQKKELDTICNPLKNNISQSMLRHSFGLDAMDSNIDDEYYIKSVDSIIKQIVAGDYLQTNFTRKYFKSIALNKILNPAAAFLKLASLSGSFYASYAKDINSNALKANTLKANSHKINDTYNDNSFIIISSSPERLVKKNGNRIVSNPIKGSVKINDFNLNDDLIKTLLNQKNKAENLMITDMLRNEFSQLSVPGEVKTELFKIDKYRHIAHLSSQIEAFVPKDIKLSYILQAVFPPASMTGAPKLAAIKAATNLEPAPRGFYSGCLGYFTKHKSSLNLDLCVLIRLITIEIMGSNTMISTQAGGGITHLSTPQDELFELKAKLQIVNKVLFS